MSARFPFRGARRRTLVVAGVLAGVLGCALSWSGCASQVPPPGGPPDTEPPEITSTTPVPGEVFFHGDRIVVGFSEYVDRRSFEESVFLSPSAGALRFDWSGSEVTIIPAETLRTATTFILTIGTDLTDTRNNRLASSFTLPFSTGGVIDSCSVSGRVYDDAPVGVMIYAYAVDESGPDTLNPAASRPDYLTQTGADGSFSLTNLRTGRYRVLAVRDVFKNLRYDIQTDMYGMPPSDIRLTPGARDVGGLVFMLASEDTVRPAVTTAKAVDRTRVTVRFNERPVRRGPGPAATVTDTLSGSVLAVLDFSPVDTLGREFTLLTGPQDSGSVYRLAFSRLEDAAGNLADSAGRTVTFTAGTGSDTVRPVMLVNIPADSVTGILPRTGVQFAFSRSVDSARFTAGFSLMRAPDEMVPGVMSWEGSMLARYDAAAPAAAGEWYELRLRAGSLRGLDGTEWADSAVSIHYRIMEERFLGSIGGRVARPESVATGGPLVVVSREITGLEGGNVSVQAGAGGDFLIDGLPEGRYILFGFLDADGDGAPDRGAPYPLRYAEAFGFYPDTLKIRPGWPLSGVRLEIGR